VESGTGVPGVATLTRPLQLMVINLLARILDGKKAAETTRPG
jgi:hypothetical protein